MRTLLALILIISTGCSVSIDTTKPTEPAQSATETMQTEQSSTAMMAEMAARAQNVILLISDGCGPASFTMARDFKGSPLSLDPYLVGSAKTYSTSSRVTDSAAGATAFASLVKTYNGAIGVNPDTVSVPTVLEAAELKGMATGLVATSRITHATPAAFSAHVRSRGMETEIAAQQSVQGIDVFLGGGSRFFLPEADGGRRNDDRNILNEMEANGYQVVRDRAGFDGKLTMPVIGLFSSSHMRLELDRDPAVEPSLAEMTEKAIGLLNQNENGFFLMVEGSRIDHAAHANDPAGHLHDILAYDEMAAKVFEFAKNHGNTLVISVSDHETGGMTVGRDGVYAWSPDELRKVTASIEVMNDMLDEGVDAVEIMNHAGVMDLTEDELVMLNNDPEAENYVTLMRKAFVGIVSQRAQIGWTSKGHTAVDVNVYAFGPGADLLKGNNENTHIGEAIVEVLELDLSAVKN